MSKNESFSKAYKVMIQEEATPEAKFKQLKAGFKPLAAFPVEKNVDRLLLSTINLALSKSRNGGFYAGRDHDFWLIVQDFYNDSKKHHGKQ